jgi:hypothetical protein
VRIAFVVMCPKVSWYLTVHPESIKSLKSRFL